MVKKTLKNWKLKEIKSKNDKLGLKLQNEELHIMQNNNNIFIEFEYILHVKMPTESEMQKVRTDLINKALSHEFW